MTNLYKTKTKRYTKELKSEREIKYKYTLFRSDYPRQTDLIINNAKK